ncbi:MAG TPA: hypothetical protein DDZ51_19125 [Planctomycetaceae bacterium]|nr:hypothetical protein [Planctomycetaceae bacterium]
MQMLHRESVPFDSPQPCVDTLRDSLNEIQRIKSRLTDLQEQLSDVLMQIQGTQNPAVSLSADPQSSPASLVKRSTAPATATESFFGSGPHSLVDPPVEPIASETDRANEKLDAEVADSIDLKKWLLDRGISIRHFVSESPFEESFDRLALRLGRDFEHLGDFYQALKRRIGGNGASKSFPLKNHSADKINRVVQFGEELLRNGFLKEFRYVRNNRTILFTPQTDGRVANFFTGNWLERYVVITVSQHLRKLYPGRTIEVLTNPQISLPDGNDFELDVLIACDSTVLWFECKTGKDYPAYLSKYGVVAKKVMQLGSSHAAMILLEELSDLEKNNNSHMAGMSVLNLKDVQRFLNSIQSALPVGSLVTTNSGGSFVAPAAVPSAVPAPTALRVAPLMMNFTEWLAVLNREQLRPLDALLRRQIIDHFFAIDNAASERTPLRKIVSTLAAQYTSENRRVSKAMINDISRALYRSGCCELALHADYPNKVWFLRNDIGWADAFDATASLYLWAGIKARERIQIGSAETVELGRVIWGCHSRDDETNAFVAQSISEMQTVGRCIVEPMDDRFLVTAIGERFWDQAEPDGQLSQSNE